MYVVLLLPVASCTNSGTTAAALCCAPLASSRLLLLALRLFVPCAAIARGEPKDAQSSPSLSLPLSISISKRHG